LPREGNDDSSAKQSDYRGHHKATEEHIGQNTAKKRSLDRNVDNTFYVQLDGDKDSN